MSVYIVTEQDTAEAVGSGDVPVLGTPRLLAWLEAATCEAVQSALAPGQTTVGVRVTIEHLAPSPIGSLVRVAAGIGPVDGRSVTCEVSAEEPDTGRLLARGSITRAIVDRDRFLSRLR